MDCIRFGIADDEPLARERIESMLQGRKNYELVVSCADGPEAVAALRNHKLDLFFLDVRMPGLDGFQVLETLSGESVPLVVFVTAFDDYALRAFEVSALDYLLKPFDRSRFDTTLARVEERLASHRKGAMSTELKEFLATLHHHAGASQYAERFPVKAGGDIYFIRAEDVDWIDSAGNYVVLHAAGKKHMIRETIKAVEARLDPRKFIRVHRSAIINVDKLRKLQPYFHGEYVVTLSDGTTLNSSRGYSDRLRALVR
jgi:two-component system LytT family response regulator